MFGCRTVVIYTYCERGEQSKQALRFFLQHALKHHDHVQFLFVINGHTCSVEELKEASNIRILGRENSGNDIGGYQYGVDFLNTKHEKYHYYFFLNETAAGPFLPSYLSNFSWLSPFIEQFVRNPNVRMVGSTINIDMTEDILAPHVQTYAFMLDAMGLDYIQEMGVWKNIPTEKHLLIRNCEIGVSRMILQRPNCEWTISSLIPEYQNLPYRTLDYNPNAAAFPYQGDIVCDGGRCFGRDVHPLEVVFLKVNRNLRSVQQCMQIQKKKLLVILPGFGEPHWNKKLDVLRTNMAILEQPWIWDVDYIICQYTPLSEKQLPSFISSRPNVRVIECIKGILGNNLLDYVHPDSVEGYDYVMLLLDDVILEKQTISWQTMTTMMEKLNLHIGSPVLKDRNMSYWEYMSIPPNQVPDKKLVVRMMRRCELFCYLMTKEAYRTYYAHLHKENPWIWGLDMILQSHLGMRVGMFQQMKMNHLFTNHTPESLTHRAEEMKKYLNIYMTTADAQNAMVPDLAHIYDNN
jgi:hypothetical protein